jgi:hypothetical protein
VVRDNSFYSNVSRGKRKKQDHDDLIPSVLELDGSSKEHRNNWARLIQKIYELDLLTCPKCQGRMRILAFIENDQLIKKILKHLGLWEVKARPPPRGNPSPSNIHIDYSYPQVPTSEDYLYCDPDYPIEAYAL